MCRWLQAVFRGEMGDTQAHELCRIANHLHLRVDLEQSNFFALQIICVRRDGIAFCVSIRMHPLLLGWKFHIKAKCSVSTSHPRGNTVDGLPRASKLKRKGYAHFPEFISQNLEYLAALWSDFDKKLSSWS